MAVLAQTLTYLNPIVKHNVPAFLMLAIVIQTVVCQRFASYTPRPMRMKAALLIQTVSLGAARVQVCPQPMGNNCYRTHPIAMLASHRLLPPVIVLTLSKDSLARVFQALQVTIALNLWMHACHPLVKIMAFAHLFRELNIHVTVLQLSGGILAAFKLLVLIPLVEMVPHVSMACLQHVILLVRIPLQFALMISNVIMAIHAFRLQQ